MKEEKRKQREEKGEERDHMWNRESRGTDWRDQEHSFYCFYES